MTETEMLGLWVYAHESWTNYPLPEPGSTADGARRAAWRDQLGDLPADAIRRALNVPVLARRDFFPSLGAVRDEALRLIGVAGPPDLDAAWAEVQAQIRRVGASRVPDWSHPAIEAAALAVGWRVLCHADEGDAAAYRQFRDFYRLTAARHEGTARPAPALAAVRRELETGD